MKDKIILFLLESLIDLLHGVRVGLGLAIAYWIILKVSGR